MDSNQSNNQYFASQPAKDTASILTGKCDSWSNDILSNGFLNKLKQMYAAYHGAYYNNPGSSHQISFSGEQGELVNLPVNDFRNIATNMLVMTTSNRPSIECRASNTDSKSARQTLLANQILEYYMREKNLEDYLKQACEYAIVYGAGFIVMWWNSTSGEMVDFDEATQTKIYDGDIEFENLTPFDVMYDSSKETSKHDWVMIRRWKNKFDLAAKFPEYADQIIQLQTKSDFQRFRFGMTSLLEKTDDVQVLEFYHNRTECMPDGRYMMFLDEQIVLTDTPLPYRTLPVYRIVPSNIHGTPYGYTPMFDIAPLQEASNSVWGTIMTNHNAFGVQNVMIPRGADIALNQIAGGLNVIEYNDANKGGGKPEPLNLLYTKEESFKILEMLTRKMEVLSGVNSTARGDPASNLHSGTSLALVQSMALQFMSGLQQSYVKIIQDVGTGIIKILQDFAHTPRLIAIAGKANRNYIEKSFCSTDINSVTRVIVDAGNPMAKTTAGKVQMAQDLIQYGEITPKDFINVVRYGELDSVTDAIVNETILIRAENEDLMDGGVPVAIFAEDHKEHIKGHTTLLFDPDLKKDADLVQRTYDHIQQHIHLLRTVDPDLLMLLNQQPLQPTGVQVGAPPGQEGQNQAPPPQQNNGPGDVMQPPQQGIQGPEIVGGYVQGPGLEGPVRIPQNPKVSAALLPNPAMQEQSLNNLK